MEKEVRVLLVDDEPDYIQPMGFWLKSKGYRVTTASNGEEAIAVVKQDPPDIVFLDLNMPVMDGFEALKNIRQFNKDIPIVLVSAYVDDQRAKEARSFGVSGIFYKGADFNEGLALLETVLRTHKNLKK